MCVLISLSTLLFPFMSHPSPMLTHSYIILHHSSLFVYKSLLYYASCVELKLKSYKERSKGVRTPSHLKLLHLPSHFSKVCKIITRGNLQHLRFRGFFFACTVESIFGLMWVGHVFGHCFLPGRYVNVI